MKLPPNPAQLRELATEGVHATRRVLALAPRIDGLLEAAEQLLSRIDALLERLAHTETAARNLLERIDVTHEAGRAVVDRVRDEFDSYLPELSGLRPVLARLADTWQVSDIDALTDVIRMSPDLAQRATDQLMPAMDKLQKIAPDLDELVANSRALNEIVGSVPGLSRAKRRADEQRSADADD